MTTLILFAVCEFLTMVIAVATGAFLMHRSIYNRYLEAQEGAQAALEARDQAYEMARSQARLELDSKSSKLNSEVARWSAEKERIRKERADLDEVVRRRVEKETKDVKDLVKTQVDEAAEKVRYAEQLVAGKLDPELLAQCQCKHPRSMHVYIASVGMFMQCNETVGSYYNQSRCACRTYTAGVVTRKQAKELLK